MKCKTDAAFTDLTFKGIVDFKGSTIVDCPDNLHPGAELIVSLSVYLNSTAFLPSKPPAEEQPKHIFNEGQETLSEQTLRERKGSLVHLFEVLDIKPVKNSTFKKKGKELSRDDLVLLAEQHHKSDKGKPKTEIVGDGEEIEVEADGEELDLNELNLIYKKYISITRKEKDVR